MYARIGEAVRQFGIGFVRIFLDLQTRLETSTSVDEQFSEWQARQKRRSCADQSFVGFVRWFMAIHSNEWSLPRDCKAEEPLRGFLAHRVVRGVALIEDRGARLQVTADIYFARSGPAYDALGAEVCSQCPLHSCQHHPLFIPTAVDGAGGVVRQLRPTLGVKRVS